MPICVDRIFTPSNIHPFETVVWNKRKAEIKDSRTGETIYDQEVEFPAFFSIQAANIVAQKYFWGDKDKGERETSFKQIVARVVNQIGYWGAEQGYFGDLQRGDGAWIGSIDLLKKLEDFEDELSYILLHQMASFNSPVWFNIGIDSNPQQSSACFLLNAEDNMKSIMAAATAKAYIFQAGSGSGLNLSEIRSEKERLTGGGKPSGPMSFLGIYDKVAAVIKSGGKTRRAAMFFGLNVDHPDIRKFIHAKRREESKQYLIRAAAQAVLNNELEVASHVKDYVKSVEDWDTMDGEAAQTVMFQNMNVSVFVSNEFMNAAKKNEPWELVGVREGHEAIVETVNAGDLLDEIARSAWECADPGMVFNDTVQKWHTTKVDGPIKTCNPCAEYWSQPNTACNLASINLRQLWECSETEEKFVDNLAHVVDVMFLAQDILIDKSDYPTPEITEGTKQYRNIGLGFANLGGLLMSRGIPYDSPEGRELAASIMSAITGIAYSKSTEIAEVRGPFPAFERNKSCMLDVMNHHLSYAKSIEHFNLIAKRAVGFWKDAVGKGQVTGFANSQATVLAPTGTISFMMDCDTTGVEPVIAIKTTKFLAGGGTIYSVCNVIEPGLRSLGYKGSLLEKLLDFADVHGHLNTDLLPAEHRKVFETSIGTGDHAISWQGHVMMMEALTPFVSGAISKTINMPNTATVEDVKGVYTMAWKAGLKAIAIYRDGCKSTQAIESTKNPEIEALEAALKATPEEEPAPAPHSRRRLPKKRKGQTEKFTIAGSEGLITLNRYKDGTLGEVLLEMYKTGSTVSGLLNVIAILLSWSAQHGTLSPHLLRKLVGQNFEPQGFTDHKKIRSAKSPVDFIARYILAECYDDMTPSVSGDQAEESTSNKPQMVRVASGEHCRICGSLMVQSGTCHTCTGCGETTGCG